MEIWKDIEGYEGLYQVSNYGRVRSLNYLNTGKTKILKQSKDTCCYFQVKLYLNGKRKSFSVHRLVAEAFIPNPFGYSCVNHRDEIPTNNFCGTPENDFNDGNLEWCSVKYNNNYGTANKRRQKTLTNGITSKTAIQYTIDGEFVREWPSTNECGRNGFCQSSVSSCCNGKIKHHKGFIWKYKEKEVV